MAAFTEVGITMSLKGDDITTSITVNLYELETSGRSRLERIRPDNMIVKLVTNDGNVISSSSFNKGLVTINFSNPLSSTSNMNLEFGLRYNL